MTKKKFFPLNIDDCYCYIFPGILIISFLKEGDLAFIDNDSVCSQKNEIILLPYNGRVMQLSRCIMDEKVANGGREDAITVIINIKQ